MAAGMAANSNITVSVDNVQLPFCVSAPISVSLEAKLVERGVSLLSGLTPSDLAATV